METAGDGGRGTDRVGLVESGIGARDRDFGDQWRMQRITEIDEARDSVLIGGIDQHVPVVGIVVDHGGAQGRKARRNGEAREKFEHARSSAVASVRLAERPALRISQSRSRSAPG